MATNKSRRNSGKHQVPGWLKTSAVVLGLITVGFVAITVANDKAPPMHALAAPAVQGAAVTAANAATVSDERPPANNHPSPNPGEKVGMPASTPRECMPYQGIVTDCTFN